MIYLVDYENVNDSGLNGMENLTSEDTVYLFYTENAGRLYLDRLNGFAGTFRVVRVEAGKQSLDMHLVSFLGYLIGERTEENFTIVSCDTDYDSVSAFWNKLCGCKDKVQQRGQIAAASMDAPEMPVESPDFVPARTSHEIVCDRIRQIILERGEQDAWGCWRIQLSLLCSELNGVKAYKAEKKRSCLKAQAFLMQGFPEAIRVGTENGVLYAYAVKTEKFTEMLGDREGRKKENDPAASCDEPSEAVSEEKDAAVRETAPEAQMQTACTESSDAPAAEQGTGDSDALPDETKAVLPSPAAESAIMMEEERDNLAAEETLPVSEPCVFKDPAEKEIFQRLREGGMDETSAKMTAPFVAASDLSPNPRLMLYNALRQCYGGHEGRRLYHSVREAMDW